MNKDLTRLVITALFAALTCVATMVIHITIPATGGYVNIGDTLVLLCAWLIGGIYGGLAAGIGSALADVFLGGLEYAPGTLVIKFLMAVAAYLIFAGMKKLNAHKAVGYILGGIVAEAIMILGYLFYEAIVLGLGYGAVAGIAGNLIQGGVCLILGYCLILVLESTKATTQIKKFV